VPKSLYNFSFASITKPIELEYVDYQVDTAVAALAKAVSISFFIVSTALAAVSD